MSNIHTLQHTPYTNSIATQRYNKLGFTCARRLKSWWSYYLKRIGERYVLLFETRSPHDLTLALFSSLKSLFLQAKSHRIGTIRIESYHFDKCVSCQCSLLFNLTLLLNSPGIQLLLSVRMRRPRFIHPPRVSTWHVARQRPIHRALHSRNTTCGYHVECPTSITRGGVSFK